jgi:hypothetical protein
VNTDSGILLSQDLAMLIGSSAINNFSDRAAGEELAAGTRPCIAQSK